MIRSLASNELESVKGLAQSFFSESCLPGALHWEHWKSSWIKLIDSDIGAIFVNEIDGEMRGMLGGLFFPCTMTGQLEALEGFWFVSPGERGKVGAIRLLMTFEAEAKKRGCYRVKMVHLMRVNPDLAESLYTRMGYELLQVNYCKEL